MEFLIVNGSILKDNGVVEGEDHYMLHNGKGELQGFCAKPGMTIPGATKKFTLFCRDLDEIVKINKAELVTESERILDEKKAIGIEFVTPHYSNMVEINLKFKQHILIDGDFQNIWFYLKI